MKAPKLLSPNDYKRISAALEARKEDSLTMAMGKYKIVVSVVPVGNGIKVWNQTHIIAVEEYCRNVYRRKYCKDIEELRWYLSG